MGAYDNSCNVSNLLQIKFEAQMNVIHGERASSKLIE